MLPKLIRCPGITELILPPGLHHVSLRTVRDEFAYNAHRAWLFEGFVLACRELRRAGCGRACLGGSYVTSKIYPGDFDATWDPAGVAADLDPVLYDPNLRLEQNRKYRGDLLIGAAGEGPEHANYQFLAHDKNTGSPKGVIGIKLNMVEVLNI
jgi:hypothetical protein